MWINLVIWQNLLPWNNVIDEMKIAVQAAHEAGNVILEIYARDFEVEFKADDSPLTEADRAAHEIIVAQLASTPYPVLSEESKAIPFEVRKEWDRFWLVDPIDGTKEFIRKNGEFTVNIALIEQGRPILGVVLVPVTSVFYLGDDVGAFKAERGIHYTSLDGLLQSIDSGCEALERISVSGTVSGLLKMVASKSHCNEQTLAFIAQAERVYGASERVSSGSSIKLCMVAEGVADFYPRVAPTCEWDTAAAQAVVDAAGGSVFIYNSEVDAHQYVTSNKSLDKVAYNKADVLNPYFIVSGLHQYNT